MIMNVDGYLSLVESQHKTRPKFMSVLRKYLEDAQGASDVAVNSIERYDLSRAVGKQLDIIGELVGVSRRYPYVSGQTARLMSDDVYRKIILATIARNKWTGTFESFKTVWSEIFAGSGISATVTDNMNMTATVMLDGDIESELAALITAGYVFPKTMGVGITYAVSPSSERTAQTSLNVGAKLAVNYLHITANAGF